MLPRAFLTGSPTDAAMSFRNLIPNALPWPGACLHLTGVGRGGWREYVRCTEHVPVPRGPVPRESQNASATPQGRGPVPSSPGRVDETPGTPLSPDDRCTPGVPTSLLRRQPRQQLVEDVVVLLVGGGSDDSGLVQEVAVDLGPVERAVRHLHLDEVPLKMSILVKTPSS